MGHVPGPEATSGPVCFPCRFWMKAREYHTIAGLLMEYLQRIPQPGEEVQVGDYMLKDAAD